MKKISLLSIVLCMMIFVITGCNDKTDNKKETKDSTVVFQYGDNIVTKAEVWLYINTVKERYEKQYGQDVWELALPEDNNGEISMADLTREEVVSEIVKVKTLCAHAEDYDVSLTEKEIAAALRLGGVRQGVKKDVIDKIVSGQKFEENDIVIAEGKLPTEGTDAYYEYFFKRELDHKPELNEDGSVNYANVSLFEQVEEGQVIAVYHPAVRGMYGFDVTGKLVHPNNVQSLPRLMGKNIKLLDDEITYVATVTGCIEEKGGSITINRVYIVNGDVSLSSGNIKFDGDVDIRGDVKPRAVIEATGNITVKGCVEAAFLKAGNDILVKQGVLGKGMGIIEAGNDISGKYFENARIYAEHDVHSNYLYNCNCVAMNKVIISGRKGAIVGGLTSAVYGVEAAELGNRTGLRTQFDIGANEYFLKKLRDWDLKIKDLSVKVTIFKEELKKLEVKFKLDILKDSPMYQNVRTALHQLMGEVDAIKAEKDAFTKELSKNATVIGLRVSGRAYAGCLITVNNAKVLLDKDVNRVWFREKNQQIVELLN